jgi:hypothetical protein
MRCARYLGKGESPLESDAATLPLKIQHGIGWFAEFCSGHE